MGLNEPTKRIAVCAHFNMPTDLLFLTRNYENSCLYNSQNGWIQTNYMLIPFYCYTSEIVASRTSHV